MKTLFSAALVALATLSQPAPFLRRATLDVGPGSGEVLIADLNRDGHLDIVTKHLLQQRITVSLGDGTGKFTRGAGSMRLPYQPGAISLGDANGDGIPDLAMASRRDGVEYAALFPGDGAGGFRPGRDHRVHDAMETYKPAVHLADINEDGAMDLVVANGRRHTIEILTGDGRGGFSAPIGVALDPGRDRYSFALGDVNGDGHLDLVSASSREYAGRRASVAVAFGNGRGQFRKQPDLEAHQGPRVTTLADVNGDGHADVVLSHATPHISVLLNDGRGRFSHAAGSPLALGGQAHAVIVRDLNGDGQVDIAAATEGSLTVLLNDGRPFSPGGSTFRAGPGAYNLAVADLNRDGKPDIALSSFEGSALTLLFGR